MDLLVLADAQTYQAMNSDEVISLAVDALRESNSRFSTLIELIEALSLTVADTKKRMGSLEKRVQQLEMVKVVPAQRLTGPLVIDSDFNETSSSSRTIRLESSKTPLQSPQQIPSCSHPSDAAQPT